MGEAAKRNVGNGQNPVPDTAALAGTPAMGGANCSDITKSQFYIIVGGISQGEIVKYERSCFWVAIGV
ncbi:hypothetical protein UXB74_24695 [Escherichia marmotae]|nr:hypothetical protein [Escherichia marmotae]